VQKIVVSNDVLTMIFWRKVRSLPDCPYVGIPIAIVPVGRSGWKALIPPRAIRSNPHRAKQIEEAQAQLQKIYALARG
jgi:hypothetical protein